MIKSKTTYKVPDNSNKLFDEIIGVWCTDNMECKNMNFEEARKHSKCISGRIIDKSIKDFVDDVHKLREYYSNGQYDAMQQHINNLTIKYLAETIIWNSTSSSMPTNPHESYNNAENFLRLIINNR